MIWQLTATAVVSDLITDPVLEVVAGPCDSQGTQNSACVCANEDLRYLQGPRKRIIRTNRTLKLSNQTVSFTKGENTLPVGYDLFAKAAQLLGGKG